MATLQQASPSGWSQQVWEQFLTPTCWAQFVLEVKGRCFSKALWEKCQLEQTASTTSCCRSRLQLP